VSFQRRAQRLMEILSEETMAMSPRANLDVISILDAMLDLRRSGVPAGSPDLRERAIALGLERRGYTTKQIAELLPHYVSQFERASEARERSEAANRCFGP
jgi:hypothetical protein